MLLLLLLLQICNGVNDDSLKIYDKGLLINKNIRYCLIPEVLHLFKYHAHLILKFLHEMPDVRHI
jgi:hypothetical protein